MPLGAQAKFSTIRYFKTSIFNGPITTGHDEFVLIDANLQKSSTESDIVLGWTVSLKPRGNLLLFVMRKMEIILQNEL